MIFTIREEYEVLEMFLRSKNIKTIKDTADEVGFKELKIFDLN